MALTGAHQAKTPTGKVHLIEGDPVGTPVPVDTNAAKTLKTAVINENTAGDKTIVAAVAGKKIKVYHYDIVVSAAVTLQWKSAANIRSGAMAFAANGGIAPAVNPPAFLLATGVNEALILTLGGAVQVSGYVSYFDDDAV